MELDAGLLSWGLPCLTLEMPALVPSSPWLGTGLRSLLEIPFESGLIFEGVSVRKRLRIQRPRGRSFFVCLNTPPSYPTALVFFVCHRTPVSSSCAFTRSLPLDIQRLQSGRD